jgi:hypothetical protein
MAQKPIRMKLELTASGNGNNLKDNFKSQHQIFSHLWHPQQIISTKSNAINLMGEKRQFRR